MGRLLGLLKEEKRGKSGKMGQTMANVFMVAWRPQNGTIRTITCVLLSSNLERNSHPSITDELK